jgi:hypothetical protein
MFLYTVEYDELFLRVTRSRINSTPSHIRPGRLVQNSRLGITSKPSTVNTRITTLPDLWNLNLQTIVPMIKYKASNDNKLQNGLKYNMQQTQ